MIVSWESHASAFMVREGAARENEFSNVRKIVEESGASKNQWETTTLKRTLPVNL
jgi:hypothetical protein